MSFRSVAAVWVLGGSLLAQAPVVRKPPTKILLPDEDSQQQPVAQDQVPTIRVQTRLVNVALNVVDQNGAPVGGLGRDDFEILEDGKPQKIAIFEKESTTPLSIVLAIDASESVLRDERLEKNAAKKFVDAILREQDELDLMDFSDSVREIVPFTNQRKQVDNGLNDLQRGASTALYDAIYLASDRLAATTERCGSAARAGVDYGWRGYGEEDAVWAGAGAGAARGGDDLLDHHCADLGGCGTEYGGEHALIQMSTDTGGKYYYVVDKMDLEPAFAHVSDDLRTQYVLGYYAPQSSKDDVVSADYRCG